MNGCVQALHQGEMFSVLVCERLACDVREFMMHITSILPTANTIKLVFGIHAACFEAVRHAAADLNVSVRDLHWKNVGMTTMDESCTVLFLDAEACSLAPHLTVKKASAT